MLLDPNQQGMLAEFEKSKEIKHVFLCSRRIGKTYMLCVYADEIARSQPNLRIKYLTSSTKAAREIVQPLFAQLLTSCPANLRPMYKVHESKFCYPNGSEILLSGTDDRGEGLRGQAAHLAIIDEAGFIDCLTTLISDVLNPMVIATGGRILLSSTPPRTPTHPFLHYIAKAKEDGTLTKRTIFDCPRFTQKMVSCFIEEAGGIDSDTCKTEYLCEVVRNLDDAVVPEFNEKTKDKCVVKEFPPLNYTPDRYVSLDIGFVDQSVALFAYFDFAANKVCIQREYVSKAATTDDIASSIKKIERELWKGSPPYKRYSDVDLRLIADLSKLHQIKFYATAKDNKEATINMLRTMVRDGQILIHESCVNLIGQLENGLWKTSSTGKRVFQRSVQHSHLDAIDALLYLIRNINRVRNPIPVDTSVYWDPWNTIQRQETHTISQLKKIFK